MTCGFYKTLVKFESYGQSIIYIFVAIQTGSLYIEYVL